MNKLLFIILSLSFGLLSASNKSDLYLINPIETPHGILLTNNYESILYLLQNGKLEKLLAAPGSGKYINVSADGKWVGLKLIDPESRLQAPAIYNLEKKTLTKLSEQVKNSGQVSFSDNNIIAYTVGNNLIIKDGNNLREIDLGFYTNRATISPDGKSVVYKNNNDKLIILDLDSESITEIADENHEFYNAAWSPNSKYLAFQSVDAKVFVYNLYEESTTVIANGENPRWSKESNSIIFYNKEIDFQKEKLINSDIFEYKINNRELLKVTDTKNIFEMNPSYSSKGEILYQNHTKNEVVKINTSIKNKPSEVIFKLKTELEKNISYSNNKKESPDVIANLNQWEHIHQVWDSRDGGSWISDPVNSDHQGYNCCGATSAMEIIASYNLLPPDPIRTHGHTSNYGKYLSDSYTFNDYTYSNFSISNGRPGFTTGAHGYMWNNGGSPNSNTQSFLQKHGIDASHSSNITWGKIKTELNLEFPYILCTTSLTDGHIVVGIGQYGEGHTLYCNDPYGDKNAGSYGRIRNGKNAIYDWADANTGHITITPVVWGVTARYSRTLKITDTYPTNNETNVSVSVNPKINFYGGINASSVENKINLFDDTGSPITIDFDLSNCEDGIVSIIPNQRLEENSNYYIIIYNGISATTGILSNQNSRIDFTTGGEFSIDGAVLDNFDSANTWELSSSGVDENKTSFNITNENTYSGSNSAKLEYNFTNSSGSYFRVQYSSEPELAALNEKSIGLWVFGDNSKNILQYWFTNDAGNLLMGFEENISWVGWKLRSLDLSTIENVASLTFNSFALRQSASGSMGGKIFFDNLTLYKTPLEIITHFPAEHEDNISVESSIDIEFNKSVNINLVESSFKISPAIVGSFNWNSENNILTFKPINTFAAKTNYQITIDTSANSMDGAKLNTIFSFSFETERKELAFISAYPRNNSNNISVTSDIILTFDGSISSSTLPGNVLFQDLNGNNIQITVDQSEYKNGKIKFTPTYQLIENTAYKIILTENVGDTKGLSLKEGIEIQFTTEQDKYLSGTIYDDFENNTGWTNPYQTEGSVGLDYLSSRFIISNAKRKTGDYSGKLEYEFLGIEALCKTSNNSVPKISSQQSFGLWVFGDNSNNVLEYWFLNDNSTVENIIVDTIDWTGWKLKSINPSDFSSSDSLQLNSIVIRQMENGNNSGIIYLDDMQTDILLPVKNIANNIPTKYSLSQNYPNPFNPTTTINYSIPSNSAGESSNVKVVVFDILGREVVTLVNKKQSAGNYQIIFDAKNISSGIYFYSLQSGAFIESKKMLLLK